MSWKKAHTTSINTIGHSVCSNCFFLNVLIRKKNFYTVSVAAVCTNAYQTRSGYLPLSICTFCKRRTVSSATILPQQRCCSQEQPRLLSSMPTISTCTPLGWWDTADMSCMEMIHLKRRIWLPSYSDSRVTEYGQSCDQMYIEFWQRVQNSEGYRDVVKTIFEPGKPKGWFINLYTRF